MENMEIPDIVVGRLPVYLRTLQQMAQQGRQVTSSQEIGERLGISAAQIRKDLSQFGEFGKQGTGYQIEYLIDQIRQILNLTKVWPVVVIGAGDIGSAIARYGGFADRGFEVQMIFDNDPHIVGKQIGNFVVLDYKDMLTRIQEAGIQVAMLAVPASQAQQVADDLVKAGVKAILNYAPININVPEGVRIQYIDPVTHLQRMTYYLA